MSGALLYIRYTVSLRLISSQSLIIEETNTHNEGRRMNTWNINCHSREKAKRMTREMDGALLFFSLPNR